VFSALQEHRGVHAFEWPSTTTRARTPFFTAQTLLLLLGHDFKPHLNNYLSTQLLLLVRALLDPVFNHDKSTYPLFYSAETFRSSVTAYHDCTSSQILLTISWILPCNCPRTDSSSASMPATLPALAACSFVSFRCPFTSLQACACVFTHVCIM